MNTQSLGWFAPPILSLPNLRRRARALWVVSWSFFAVVAVVLGIMVLVEPDTLARRGITVAAVGILVILLHLVSRTGRPILASWMLVIGLSLIVTQRAWITGGIYAPVAVFYALFVVTAGVLIGPRGAVVTAAVCLLGAIVLTIGTSFGLLITRPGVGAALPRLILVILALGMALVVDVLVNRWSHRGGVGADAVQMLVHDMRSPLQVLLAHLDLLRQDVRGESVEDVDAAIGGAATLNRMTSSLLDVGRFEAGRMPVQKSATDLAALANSVVKTIRVLQPARVITVESSGDAVCNCDSELIRRVIDNLVSNAIKHTPIEGRVRVIISGSRESVRIAVQDEGPGVPPENRRTIFHPYSAEGLQTVSGYQSSGLGLTFCCLALEAHGGTIRIEDAKPRGSIFVAELPR